MHENDVKQIGAWLVERGLAGASETELLHGFCERSCQAGLPLSRALALVDTLHPVYEGRAFRWRNDGVEESAVVEYGSSSAGEAAASWQSSPFHHLLTSGANELRRRIGRGDPVDFPVIATLKQDGYTDYVAMIHRFAGEGAIGEMDCVYSHWMTSQRRRLRRSRHGGAAAARAVAGAGDQDAPRWRASPARWSRSISAATPASAC